MVGLFFSALTLLLLSQVTNGKTTSMKLSPPGGSGSALKDHRLSTTGKPTNQPGALLSADRQRLQNLMAPFQENTSTKGASKESSGSDGVVLPRAAASSSKGAIGDISSESGEESGGGEEDVIATKFVPHRVIGVGTEQTLATVKSSFTR